MGDSIVLRMNVNSQAAVKLASLVSNTVLLAANVYLVSTGIRQQVQVRRQERISSTLQSAAEIATAVAGLTQVVTSTLERYREPGG